MLPFTDEVYLSIFSQYNRAIWPVQLIAYGLGASMLFLAVRPGPRSGQIVTLCLAFCWVWTGVVYHGAYLASILWAAPLFGLTFALQGLLLFQSGVVRKRLHFGFEPNVSGLSGLGLLLIALAGPPLMSWAAGHDLSKAGHFGTAPAATTIFTFGLLLLTERPAPCSLFVIPLLWAVINGAAAWEMRLAGELLLPLSACVFVLLAARRRMVRS